MKSSNPPSQHTSPLRSRHSRSSNAHSRSRTDFTASQLYHGVCRIREGWGSRGRGDATGKDVEAS